MTVEGVPTDGKFHLLRPGSNIEMAISHNKRDVMIRNAHQPEVPAIRMTASELRQIFAPYAGDDASDLRPVSDNP